MIITFIVGFIVFILPPIVAIWILGGFLDWWKPRCPKCRDVLYKGKRWNPQTDKIEHYYYRCDCGYQKELIK